jgi:ribosomal protein L31
MSAEAKPKYASVAFICDICNNSFTTKYSLKRNKNNIHNNSENESALLSLRESDNAEINDNPEPDNLDIKPKCLNLKC